MFWVSSDLNSGKKEFFIFGGGGVFWVRLDLDSGNNFNFWGGVFWNQIPEQGRGVFWVRLDLDSGNNFNFLGRGVLEPNSRTGGGGCSGEFGQNFLEA